MAFKCKHGLIIYGAKCLNCEREKKAEAEEKKQNDEAIKRIKEKAKNLGW